MDYRDEYRRHAPMARFAAWKLALWVVGVGALFGVVGIGFGWFGEAATVTREQMGPRAAIRKYEWFKDAAAQLDRKRADIDVYRARVAAAEKRALNGDRTDRERLSVMEAELAGVLASYNALAAEYNAASSKFNWAPLKGDVPETVAPYTEGR